MRTSCISFHRWMVWHISKNYNFQIDHGTMRFWNRILWTAVFAFLDLGFDIGHGGFGGIVSSGQTGFPPGIIVRIKPNLHVLGAQMPDQARNYIMLALLLGMFLFKGRGMTITEQGCPMQCKG